jgi:hypothetical protein
MSEPLVFDDITLVEIPVSIKGVKYVLREGTEGAVKARENVISAAMKFGPDGKPVGVVGNINDADTVLLANCLYEADEGGRVRLMPSGDPDPRYLVSAQKIRNWPARVVKPLVEKLKEITQLNEAETKDSLDEKIMELREQRAKLEAAAQGSPEKNGQRAMTPTSV